MSDDRGSRKRGRTKPGADAEGPEGAGDPVADRIRRRRTELGWSLAELAAKAGLRAPSHVYHIEAGEKAPSEEVARALAEALGDDPDVFEAWARLRGRADLPTALSAARTLDALLRPELRPEARPELPSESRPELASESRPDLPSESRSDLPSESRSDLPSESRSDLPSESGPEAPPESHPDLPSESGPEAPPESPPERDPEAESGSPRRLMLPPEKEPIRPRHSPPRMATGRWYGVREEAPSLEPAEEAFWETEGLDDAASSASPAPPEPRQPSVPRIPLFPEGADPEAASHRAGPARRLRFRAGVLEADSKAVRILAGLERPFAYHLTARGTARTGALMNPGDVAVLTRRVLPLRPWGVYAVRTAKGAELGQVRWDGRRLLLLPSPGEADFEVLQADDRSELLGHLLGRVALLVPPDAVVGLRTADSE